MRLADVGTATDAPYPAFCLTFGKLEVEHVAWAIVRAMQVMGKEWGDSLSAGEFAAARQRDDMLNRTRGPGSYEWLYCTRWLHDFGCLEVQGERWTPTEAFRAKIRAGGDDDSR